MRARRPPRTAPRPTYYAASWPRSAIARLRFMTSGEHLSRGLRAGAPARHRPLRAARVRPGAAEHSKSSEAALQISALDAVGHKRQSASIRIRRSLESAEPAQHVGAGGVEQVIPIERPGGP